MPKVKIHWTLPVEVTDFRDANPSRGLCNYTTGKCPTLKPSQHANRETLYGLSRFPCAGPISTETKITFRITFVRRSPRSKLKIIERTGNEEPILQSSSSSSSSSNVVSLVITSSEQEGVCGYLADCRSLGIHQKASI